MRLRTRLAVLVCKASGAVLRRLGRGGTNLPGKLALKIDRNILGELARGVKVTVVTGTNGKTTTSRMIEQAFSDAGLKYFSNKSGANLLTGIIAVFAQHSTLSGRCPYTHALIECDEAAFRKTSEYLPVECLVVNNIFRDQLDRYGEITHTLNAIREGITHVPNATLCLNADCSLTASLAEEPHHPLRRQRADLQGNRARAFGRRVLHPLQDPVRVRLPHLRPSRRLPLSEVRLSPYRARGRGNAGHRHRRGLLGHRARHFRPRPRGSCQPAGRLQHL